MERAERIIALGVGLLFDSLLIGVLWLMLALTLVTAVQRFVKVWQQASRRPSPPRRRAAGRPGGPPAPPSGPGAGGSAPAAASPPSAGLRGRPRHPRATRRPPRVARALPHPVAADRRPGARAARRPPGHGAPGPGRAEPPPGRPHPLRRPRSAGSSTRPSRATPATTRSRSGCPGTSAADLDAGFRADGFEHRRRGPRRRATAPSWPCRTSAAGSGPGSGSRRCSTVRVTAVVEALDPRDAVRVVRRRCAGRSASRSSRSDPTPAPPPPAPSRPTTCSPCSATATSPAPAPRSSSSASAPRCPGGPATLALRTGAPILPTAIYFDGPDLRRSVGAAAARHHAPGQAPRRRPARHPGPRPRPRGPDPAGPPSSGTSSSPTGRRTLPLRHSVTPASSRRRNPSASSTSTASAFTSKSGPGALPCLREVALGGG